MPFCPNGKELHIAQRSENLLSKQWTPAPVDMTAPASCTPADLGRSLFTPMKSAALPQAAKEKKTVTTTSRWSRNDNLPVSSLNLHHLGLKRHFIDKKCRRPNSSCVMIASKKETTPHTMFSWKAKVSIVPLK